MSYETVSKEEMTEIFGHEVMNLVGTACNRLGWFASMMEIQTGDRDINKNQPVTQEIKVDVSDEDALKGDKRRYRITVQEITEENWQEGQQ